MTFLWHDYETFGTNAAFDGAAQFAAQRTDAELNPVGEPTMLYCKPTRDALPHPMACLVTGITPQRCEREGVVEADFARRVHAEMMEPRTCCVGYNSMKFDDQVSRHLFYRNFIDPYEREWRNGNSRWDLIGLVRMCYALRPEGLKWPTHDSGLPSFRLQDLSEANGIEHRGAHDALADVRATIDLARRVRDAQPRLYAWALSLREATRVIELLDLEHPRPVVHTSGRIAARRGCTSLVLPLAGVPERRNWVIVFDLMADPGPLLELSAEDIADRVFTPTADLPEDVERIPLKTIAPRHAPLIAPAGVLRGVDTERIELDPELCQRHARQLLEHLPSLREKLRQVFAEPPPQPMGDPDDMLYSGGFFSDRDRAAMNRVLATAPEKLGQQDFAFQDPRLPEMLFRYRARNWPETLDNEEFGRWEQDRLERLREPRTAGRLGIREFEAELAEARKQAAGDGARLRVLDAVEAWAVELLPAAE